MSEQNKAIVRRLFDEMSNGNWDMVKEMMAPNHVFHFPLSPQPLDRESHVQMNIGFRAAFPDLRYIVEDQIAEGDKVVTRGVVRGTHKGEFQGIPPTGASVTIRFINIMRIADGLDAEEKDSVDGLGFMQQLGVVPTPGQG